MFVVSSTFASYVGKVSVRVDLQRIGFAIPGFIGPICAVTIAFIFDTISYREGFPNIKLDSSSRILRDLKSPCNSAYTETLSSDEKNVSVFDSSCDTDQTWIKSATEEKYLIWGYNDYRLDGLGLGSKYFYF